jgi:acyl-CoA thioesterase
MKRPVISENRRDLKVENRREYNPETIMDEEMRTSLFKAVAGESYAQKLKLRLVAVEPGRAIVEMVPGKDDANIFGMIHGGAIFSLMDEAFQVSCNSHGTVAMALSVNVTFHNPPETESRLRAESKEIHRSNKIGTYEIRVIDDDGVLIASCQAIASRKKEKLPFLEGIS